MVGSTFKRINIQQIKNFTIPMPSPFEQQAIAEALSDVDALISALDRLIAKKRAIKQGAMQELLRPKDTWVTESIGALFHLSTGSSKSKVLSHAGRFVVMDMGSVSSVGTILASKRTDYDGDILILGDLVMPKDDIGGGQIIGKVAFIDRDTEYVLGDHVYRLQKTQSQIDTLFFYHLINSSFVNSELKKKVAGSAQLGLGRKSVMEQSIAFPADPTEQTAIATILSDMDAEIAALERRRDKTKLLKQGMMQELLTGRIRLV
jgi:type I restriction enzyme S subunit